MAGKGQQCPECGKSTFYPPAATTGAQTCSQCKARGWHSGAKPKAVGKGDPCLICGNSTYRIVATVGGATVRYCSICEAAAIVEAG